MSMVVQGSSHSILPCLTPYWISGHNLLRTKLYNLLEADGNNGRLLLESFDIRPQPGCKIFLDATSAAVQIEGPNPDLNRISCGILIEPRVLLP